LICKCGPDFPAELAGELAVCPQATRRIPWGAFLPEHTEDHTRWPTYVD
jgi:hypothetical protein